MTGNDSFDPHSWIRPESAAPAQEDTAPSALPSAWQSVVDTDEADPANVPKSNNWGRLLAAVATLVLIGVGMMYGYRYISPPDGTPNDGASPLTAPAGQSPAPDATKPGTEETTRRLILAGPADLDQALRSAGVPATEVTEASTAMRRILGKSTGQIQAIMHLVTTAGAVHLARLDASFPDGSGAIVERSDSGEIRTARVAAELSRQIKIVRGEIDTNTFYSSAVSAGVVDSLIPEFANAFSFDFDLQQEVAPGDTFEVAYEQTVNAEGQPIGQPQLLYASLVTAAKRRALYRFKPADQEVGWFDGNGASTVRSLMRTPVDGARISSKFGFRMHPVLGYMKLHRGTDFAAPIGTPIYASGDATVEWAAMKGPNGNLTILRHDNGWQTYYLHQSMFMPGVTPGARVHQGQKIGEIGTTGRSTGPHLHYEVHIDGQAVDPLGIKTESGRGALEGAQLAAFIQQRNRVDVARARQMQ